MDGLVKSIRDSMRIKHSALDADIEGNILAAASDMVRVGIQPYSDMETKQLREDPLVRKAVELYCKAQADYMGKGTQYEASYEKLRDALSLCGDYSE